MPTKKRSFQEIEVLILEDSMDLREQFIRVLEASRLGFIVETLPSSVGLNKKLTTKKYDAVVLDFDIAVGDPESIIKSAKEIDPFMPVIVISRNYSDSVYHDAIQMGADTYIPFTQVAIKMFPRVLLERVEGIGFIREAIESRHQSTFKSYQLEILASLVRKMVETNDLKSVMQEMAEQIVRKLDMKAVSLQRYFPRQNGFAVYGIYPQGKLVKFAQMFFGISLDSFIFPFDPEHCIVDQYTLERKPWVGNDFADVFGTTMPAQASRMIQKFAGVSSIYNAPFYSKDQLLGGIVVGNVRKSFSEEELEAFDAIVHISSLLFEYNQTVKSQIIQNHKLQAIHEISSQLHENLEPEKIFDIIHEKLNTIVPADVVQLFFFEKDRNVLVEKKIVVRKGKRPSFMFPEIIVGRGLLGKAALESRSLLENDAHLNPNSVYSSGRPNVEHILAVPITHNNELLGMISMTRLKDEPFSESDKEALEIFTSQFGIAFHNSRLYQNLQRSESLYRLVLENVNDPVLFVGVQGKLLFVNPKFEDLTGYRPDEVLGKEFDFLIHPEDIQMVKNYYLLRITGKEAPARYEFRVVRKSGEIRTVGYSVTAISENGKITGLLAVARDITDEIIARKNLEQKTQQLQELLDINMLLMHSRDSNELLEKLIAAARGAVPNADAGAVMINDRSTGTLKLSASSGYPLHLRDAFAFDRSNEWVKAVFDGGRPVIIGDSSGGSLPPSMKEFPKEFRPKSFIAAPLVVDNEVLGIISLDSFTRTHAFGKEQLQFLEAIAHQAALALKKERMNADLKESETRYRTITESSSDLIVVTDESGRIEFTNDKFDETFGRTAASLRGESLVPLFEESSRSVMADMIKRGSAEKRHRVTSVIDGLRHHFDVVSSGIATDAGNPRKILFLNDVSDLVRTGDWMERAYEVGLNRSGIDLVQSYTDLLSDVFNSELVYIGECNDSEDTSLAQIAKIGSNYLHTFAFTGVQLLLRNEPEGLIKVGEIFRNGNGWKSYHATSIDVNNRSVGLIVLASEKVLAMGRAQMSILKLIKQRLAFEYERQVTESETRRLEEQLRHSQKMESLGTLAGGVAHDFNNILGAILGYAGLMKVELKNNEKLVKYLSTIEKSARRASDLTKQLLGFARAGKTSVTTVDFNRICAETVELTRKLIEKNIIVTLDLFENLPPVEGDESQLSQVMLNLAINARDAMPDGGTLRISTSFLSPEQRGNVKLELEDRVYIVVEVADSGMGVSKEIQSRMFEPFFTTKPKGKGTGLGLSMVYGIVKNHGGEVEVQSELQKGTTFRIFLPASTHVVSTVSSRAEDVIERVISDKTCLVVDDEKEIRDILEDSLTRFGFTVLTADSGEKALELLKSGVNVDLVVLDMIMPGMDGRDTYFQIRSLKSNLPVFVSTGYSAEGKVEDIMTNGGIALLHKPFTLQDIRAQLIDKFIGLNEKPGDGKF